MAMESPLFLTRVECPVCGTLNEFETIRVGAYTEGERETDFCPSIIKWRNPKYQKYHPLLFFTSTCSHCFYTREFNNRFREWSRDNNFRTYRLRTVKEKHLSELAAEESFIKLIGLLIDGDKYPDETAVLKLILAIYDELLCEHPSHLDLGRFYLRIAWLFRHGGAAAGPYENAPVSPTLVDLEQATGELRTWLAGLGRNIEYLRQAASSHLERQGTDNEKAGDESTRRGYDGIFKRLAGVETECGAIVSDLEATLTAARPEAVAASVSGEGNPFYQHASFGDFLSGLARIWDGVPRHEHDALRFAVRNYIKAFENGKEIDHGNQSIQAAYLISELSRRIGDHDTARQYFNTTIKMGQEYINEIRGDRTRTALTRKLLEMALAQGKKNLAEANNR